MSTCNRLVVFRHPLRQALGLMFQKPRSGTLYLFDFGRDVHYDFHMWFVFWPIDLYLLDEKKRVIEAKRDFRPFMRYAPTIKYRYAVETKAGSSLTGLTRLL